MFYWISCRIFELGIRICFKCRFFGRERIPKAPYFVVSNHASIIDPPLVGMACRKNIIDFMAKRELFEMPGVGIWTRSVGCIPVDRGKSSVKGLREAVRRVKAGRVVGVFPEGTRATDNELQNFKRGIGFLVAHGQVPIVPVYIEGSGNAFPKGKRPNFRTPINIYVGEVIHSIDAKNDLSGRKDYDSIVNLVMERISSAKNKNLSGKA